jgi:ankyrin repeat protein
VRLLLEKEVDVEMENEIGMTASHCAALNGHETVVQLLLEKGANMHAKAHVEVSALELATIGGHEATV